MPSMHSAESILQSLSGSKLQYNMEQTDFIMTIKSLLEKKEGINVKMIRLIHAGKQLTVVSRQHSDIWSARGKVTLINADKIALAPVVNKGRGFNCISRGTCLTFMGSNYKLVALSQVSEILKEEYTLASDFVFAHSGLYYRRLHSEIKVDGYFHTTSFVQSSQLIFVISKVLY